MLRNQYQNFNFRDEDLNVFIKVRVDIIDVFHEIMANIDISERVIS